MQLLFAEIDKSTSKAKEAAYYLYEFGIEIRDEGGLFKGDVKKAFSLFMKAANAELPEAEYMIGISYQMGVGIDDNLSDQTRYDEMLKWFRKAASHGYEKAKEILKEMPKTMYETGVDFKKGRFETINLKKAVFFLEKSCEMNYVPALNMLGEMYFFGDGIEKDLTKAFSLWLTAASKGDAFAQRRIGVCYASGYGCSVNLEESFKWYLKAAKNNEPFAQFKIAEAYASGIVINKDVQEAMKWCEMSANNGFAQAQYELATLLLGNADGKKRYAEGVTLLKKAAEQEECKAMFLLGLLAASAEDVSEAEKWLKKAMNHKECDEKSRNEISSLLNVGGLFGISKKESLKMSAGLILMELFPNLYEK